jgi:hypothetical protein
MLSACALLDEKPSMACMAYVDLNPVRAGMAEPPEQSEYTSIKERTHQFKQYTKYRRITAITDVYQGR